MKKIILFLLLSFIISFAQTAHNGNGERVYLKVDNSTHALNMIDYEHHEIHSGSHYFIATSDTMASGDTLFFEVVVPDTTREAHFLFTYTSSGLLKANVREGTTITGGDTLTTYNSNRNSSKSSMLTIVGGGQAACNLDSAGTALLSLIHGSSDNKNPFGGSGGRGSEIILKNNTSYVFEFISGADNNYFMGEAEWYEHIPKD